MSGTSNPVIGDFGGDGPQVLRAAPQESPAPAPALQDVQSAGAPWDAVAKVGQTAEGIGLQQMAQQRKQMELQQKQIDLNYAVGANAALRQGAAKLSSDFQKNITGDEQPADVLADFQTQFGQLTAAQAKGAQNVPQNAAVQKAAAAIMDAYTPQVLKMAQKALDDKNTLTLKNEMGGFEASSMAAINGGDTKAAGDIIRGNAVLLGQAIDARVAAGAFSPLQGAQLKQTMSEKYYADMTRALFENPQTRDEALDAWNTGAPFLMQTVKGADGQDVQVPLSLRQLVGSKNEAPLEAFSQRIFAEQAAAAERALREQEIADQKEANKKLRETMRWETQQRLAQHHQEYLDQKRQHQIDYCFKTPAGQDADMLIRKAISPKWATDDYINFKDTVRKRVAAGQDVLSATRSELAIYNSQQRPAWFHGNPNSASDVANARALIKQQLMNNVLQPAVANMRLNQLNAMTRRAGYAGGR